MPAGMKLPPVVLTEAERQTLEGWVRRHTTAQVLATRARIVLECAKGLLNIEVADRLGVARPTVGRWRRRFLERRCDGLLDEPRSGRPRSVSDADVERVITMTLETTPKDATHWSIRSMAEASGMSRMTVARIWKAFGLQPHRVRDVQAVQRSAVRGQGA